ncbi:hypothetical protein N7444_002661 [Penicillium canescens]|nr:hypothetical protein N7444_002661 [Penicillium canescens]
METINEAQSQSADDCSISVLPSVMRNSALHQFQSEIFLNIFSTYHKIGRLQIHNISRMSERVPAEINGFTVLDTLLKPRFGGGPFEKSFAAVPLSFNVYKTHADQLQLDRDGNRLCIGSRSSTRGSQISIINHPADCHGVCFGQ